MWKAERGSRYCIQEPERWPEVIALPVAPFRLRLPHFERVAKRLVALGFRELGTRVEITPVGGIPSRVFFHPELGTYAEIYSFLLVPRISFLTPLSDGRMLYSGRAGRGMTYARLLTNEIPTHHPERGWARHRERLQSLDQQGTRPSAKGTLEERLALTRAWYRNYSQGGGR